MTWLAVAWCRDQVELYVILYTVYLKIQYCQAQFQLASSVSVELKIEFTFPGSNNNNKDPHLFLKKQDQFRSGVAKLMLGIAVLKSLIYFVFLKLFKIILFFSFYFIFSFCFFLVVFPLDLSIINLSSFLIMNQGIHTNKKWNYGHYFPLKYLSYSISFYSILFPFYFILFYSLVVFLLDYSIIHLLSFLIMKQGIRTNKKWNYEHVSVLPIIFVSCSLAIESIGRHSSFLSFEIIILFYLNLFYFFILFYFDLFFFYFLFSQSSFLQIFQSSICYLSS